MLQLGLLLWGLFFVLLAFSMFPWHVSAVIVISFIGGLIDGISRIRKQKDKRPDFELDKSETVF